MAEPPILPDDKVLTGLATYQGRRYYVAQGVTHPGLGLWTQLCDSKGEVLWVGDEGLQLDKPWSRPYSLSELAKIHKERAAKKI